MILIANLSPAHSASRTIPYVPAPNVLPNRYWALETLVSRHAEREKPRLHELLIIAVWLAGQLVHHI